MKKHTLKPGMIVCMIFSLSIGMIKICSAAEIKVRTEFHFDYWKSNADIDSSISKEAVEGSQIYIPIRIGSRYQEFSFDILTGYHTTNVDLSNGEAKSFNDFLDTKVNFAYEILGRLPLDILLGLDLNLPTGRTNLTTNELFLILDPDLVSITAFGEGLNVNPTVSLAGEWGDWTAGVGFGYNWRGEYDYSSEIGIEDYDPGDIINLTTEINYDFHLNWQARFFSEFALFCEDKVRKEAWYEEGDFLLLGLQLNYYQAQWDADFTLRSIQRGKSKRIQEGGMPILSTEDKNSHGDEWIADFGLRYSLSDQTRLNSSIELLWAEENDYPSDSLIFVGRKEKLSLGVGATTLFTPFLEGKMMFKGFYLNGEDRDFRGFSFTAQLAANF